jgi:hypothetical protein
MYVHVSVIGNWYISLRTRANRATTSRLWGRQAPLWVKIKLVDQNDWVVIYTYGSPFETVQAQTIWFYNVRHPTVMTSRMEWRSPVSLGHQFVKVYFLPFDWANRHGQNWVLNTKIAWKVFFELTGNISRKMYRLLIPPFASRLIYVLERPSMCPACFIFILPSFIADTIVMYVCL